MSIDIPETKTVPIDELTTDGFNPNFMSDKKFSALQANIKKYGFIVPIITNNEGLVADGEHRLRAAKALGMKEVAAIQLPIKDVDRRILRQVLNKVKGEHDFMKDSEEFEKILEDAESKELQELLAIEQQDIEDILALQGSDEELYEEIMKRKDAREKEIYRFNATVPIEKKNVILQAIDKSGYKDHSRALIEICEQFNKKK